MKKRVLSLLLVLLLTASLMCVTAQASSEAWDGRTSEAFAGGTGTIDDPYQIANGAQLYYLSQQSETNNYYVLTRDIDLGSKLFPMISSFAGTLDGSGHNIINLNLTSTETGSNSIAAMIKVCTGTVKNLTVLGEVTSTAYRTAAIVGSLNGGVVTNCINRCSVNSESGTSSFTGGIASCIAEKGQISDCVNLGAISGAGYVGGIAAAVSNDKFDYADDTPSITGCQNAADVYGKTVGGICGSQSGTTISECVNTGNIVGSSIAGGVIGDSYSNNCTFRSKINMQWKSSYSYSSSFIHDCYNTGRVEGAVSAGGIAATFARCSGVTEGYHQSRDASMGFFNCYNIGRVVATNEDGQAGDIMSKYRSDTSSKTCGTPKNCLYLSGNNSDASSEAQALATGCSSEELSSAGVYVNNNFDFSAKWTWDDSGKYPYAILKRVGIPKSVCEHDYVLTNSTASCLEAGEATYTCSKCGDIVTESAPATGHTEVIDEAVAATCTETGLTEGKHCSVCNAIITAQVEVTAPGHTEVIDEAVSPTCTETGLTEGKHCSVCNEIIFAQEEVDATGHHFKGNTCTDCGATRSTGDTIRAWFQDSFNNFKSFFDKLFGR